MDSGNTMSDSRVGVKLVVVEVVVVIVFAPKSLYVGKTHFYVHGDKRIREDRSSFFLLLSTFLTLF